MSGKCGWGCRCAKRIHPPINVQKSRGSGMGNGWSPNRHMVPICDSTVVIWGPFPWFGNLNWSTRFARLWQAIFILGANSEFIGLLWMKTFNGHATETGAGAFFPLTTTFTFFYDVSGKNKFTKASWYLIVKLFS